MADRTIKPDSGNDLVLQNNGGGTKIEIPNSGDIAVTGTIGSGTFNGSIGSSATGLTGIKNIQEWGLTSDYTSSASSVSMMNNWAIKGDSIGTALTFSQASANDRFEFPQTGIWSIDFQCNGQVGTNGSYFQFIIYWCTDGSTFNKYALSTSYFDDATQSDGSQLYLKNSLLLDVTDISQVYFRISQTSNSSTVLIFADASSTAQSATSIRVTRIGDT